MTPSIFSHFLFLVATTLAPVGYTSHTTSLQNPDNVFMKVPVSHTETTEFPSKTPLPTPRPAPWSMVH